MIKNVKEFAFFLKIYIERKKKLHHKNQMLQNGRQVLQRLGLALACVVAYLPVLAVIPNKGQLNSE